MANVEIKHFTPSEAKKTLPLVRKIVEDILREGRELKLLAEDLKGEIDDNPEAFEKINLIQSYMMELSDLGCFFKDWNFEIGLVDFPSIIDGKEVLLCWRSDEESVLYYHDYDSGYQGRKLIPEEYLLI